jgi:hypothetical protein
MSAIFFSAKRVFHGAVGVTRKSLLSVKYARAGRVPLR